MSSFDPSQATNLPKNQLNYNLTYQKDVFKTDVQTLTRSNGQNYYKILYNNDPNINFSYSTLVPSGYSAVNFYIFGILHHNIIGLTDSPESLQESRIVGELVVEYRNTTNSNMVYTCFFLATAQNPSMAGTNTTDNIVAMITGKLAKTKIPNVALNDDIPTQTNAGCFIYKDTMNPANTVVVFLNPIIINPETSQTISALLTADTNGNTPLFSVNAPLSQDTTNNISNQPNADDENIYIDCNPSGESNETIQTYNLPINSDLMGDKNQMSVMKTALNFFMFIILILFVYVTIPKLYKKVVIDGSNKFFKDNAGALTTPLVRIRSIDMWLSIIFIITCLILFDNGFKNDNYSSLSAAMYLMLIFGLSVALIQSYKSNETDFMKTIIGSCGKIGENYIINKDSWEYTNLNDFFRTLSDGLVYYVKDVLRVHVALSVVAIAFISVSNGIMKKPFNNDFGKTVGNWIFFLAPISFIIRSFM